MDKEPYDDGRMTFYYSREERLKKASQTVRDLNEPSPPWKPNLFKTLTSSKPLAFLFISIVILCATVIIFSRVLNDGRTAVLENNAILISAISSGENSYITVKKTSKNDDAYTGPVDLAVSLPGETVIQGERIYFTLEEEEIFRFSVPFTGNKILILMEVKEAQALFTISPE
jgi:hypothetical protein